MGVQLLRVCYLLALIVFYDSEGAFDNYDEVFSVIMTCPIWQKLSCLCENTSLGMNKERLYGEITNSRFTMISSVVRISLVIPSCTDKEDSCQGPKTKARG